MTAPAAFLIFGSLLLVAAVWLITSYYEPWVRRLEQLVDKEPDSSEQLTDDGVVAKPRKKLESV